MRFKRRRSPRARAGDATLKSCIAAQRDVKRAFGVSENADTGHADHGSVRAPVAGQ
jgi:hypothetical protein